MRDLRTAVVVVLIALIFFLIFPSPSWAADSGSSIFQNRCAVCHGVDGLANTPMGKKQSIPSFASEKVQKHSSSEIVDFILNGGPEKRPSHSFAGKGISQEDAAKLAFYIKSLGKKK